MSINLQEQKSEIIKTIKQLAEPLVIKDLEEKLNAKFKTQDVDEQDLYNFIFDTLYDNHLIFAVDWKWTVDEELADLKQLIPNFTCELVDGSQDDDYNVSGILKANGKEYSLENASLFEFFDEINHILRDAKSSKRVLKIEVGTGDTTYFCVVEETNYHDLLDNRFLPYLEQ